MKRKALPWTVLFLASGCSVVKEARVVDDWATVDKDVIKRIAVVVAPHPGGVEAAGKAVARLARRYVHMKREFIVLADASATQAPSLSESCEGGRDAVLTLALTATPQTGGFTLEAKGLLLRCKDGREEWSGSAGGSFRSDDSGLTEVAQNYAREFGEEARPFIAPAMNLLRPLLDTLPNPTLVDADVEDKMSSDE